MAFLVHRAPEGVTGRGGLPWIGTLVPFARDPLVFLEGMHRDFGDVCWFRIMDHDLWMLSHPGDIETALVKLAKGTHKDAIYELLKPVLGEGLVTAEDDRWRRHRKLAAPSFAKKHVDGYAAEMVRCAAEWADGLADGAERDVHADFMALTQQIVLHTLFGADLDGGRLREAAHAIEVVMDEFAAEAQGPRRVLPRSWPTPGRRRAARAVAELDAVLYALIAARRAAGPGDDLLSRLLESRDEAGGLSDVELRDEAVTVFVAGHETTALALTYAVHLLARRPEAVEALCAEVDGVLGGRRATADDYARLPFAKAVVQETMRVLPPVWAIGREAMEDLEVAGRRIPKGAQILIAQWVVHHDGRWFSDPTQFRPERWLDGLEERLPRCAYLPFGAGPRICIGNHFALLEAVLVLATIAQRVRFSGAELPRLLPSITLRPRGPVTARAHRR